MSVSVGSAVGHGRRNAFAPSTSVAERVVRQVSLWVGRVAARRRLAQLDSYLLADIGLTQDQVAVEVAKPFWRA